MRHSMTKYVSETSKMAQPQRRGGQWKRLHSAYYSSAV